MAAFGLYETLDLSRVTARLVTEMKLAFSAWPGWPGGPGSTPDFNFTISGAMPESVRADGGCQVNLYLVHVSRNPFQSNAPLPEPAREIPELRLSLDLYYLLTAFSNAKHDQEQRAMSIALRFLHENPTFSTNVVVGGQTIVERFHITLETETPDALGRLWQSFHTPLRLSAIYKACVVYITPQPTAPLPKPVQRVLVAAAPALLAGPGLVQVLGTTRSVSILTPASPTPLEYDLSPATVAAGDRFWLLGTGLDQPGAARVFLRTPGGGEQAVTSWRQATGTAADRLLLRVPTTNVPAAGVYGLCVGPSSGPERSNLTPLTIAAAVDPPTAPPPLLTAAAGVYTVTGSGFVAGATVVLLGGTALAEAAGAPGAGEFRVAATGDALELRAPTGLPSALHAVRIRVNGIESTPAWWVQT